MLYREAGQFKTSYGADQAIFPIAQDRWGVFGLLGLAWFVIPFTAGEYLLSSVLTPFLILGLAALGLNILTGYTGQLSLGTGGFMAVGAYSAYNFATRLPELPIIVSLLLAGLTAMAAGIVFGLPSLRIKGFYLAVTTLAAQFFFEWLFSSVAWFTGGVATMTLDTPRIEIFGYELTTPRDNYFFVLAWVCLLSLAAKNLVRSRVGRSWMAIRDMDVAAEIIGIRPLPTKLLAFGVSSFYCGIAGALYAFAFLRSVDMTSFDLFRSFEVLFMIIIGGLGSILGSYLGAAFIVLMPIVITTVAGQFTEAVQSDFLATTELMVFGGLIIFFLIVEPFGLARIWQTTKEKLRLWPFPH